MNELDPSLISYDKKTRFNEKPSNYKKLVEGVLSAYEKVLSQERKYSTLEVYDYMVEHFEDEKRPGESFNDWVWRNTPTDIQKEKEIEKFAAEAFGIIAINRNEYYQNFDALERLETELNRIKGYIKVDNILVSLPWDAPNMLVPILPYSVDIMDIAGIESNDPFVAKVKIDLIAQIERLIFILKMLLDYFGNDEITVTIRVKTGDEDDDIIDYFIKMPDGRQFALMLRSNKNTFVRWRDDKKHFVVYKKGRKSASKWSSMEIAINKLKSTIELKHRSSPLVGLSKTDRNRPINKVIVLCNNTKLANNNDPDLLADFGQTKALRIYKDSLTYVIEQNQLIDFLLPPKKG